MRMTNKVKTPRAAMASPFEPVRESANASVRGQRSNLSQTSARYEGHVCALCGANCTARHARGFRTSDLILCCLSSVVLIALLLFVGSHFNSWAERLFDPVFDHWVWHEPLDDWNL
jgi:hypothetical protein